MSLDPVDMMLRRIRALEEEVKALTETNKQLTEKLGELEQHDPTERCILGRPEGPKDYR